MSEAPEIMPPEPTSITALQAQDAAALDVQVSTAKAYPRSITRFRNDLAEWSCYDEGTAAGCTYALPVSGTTQVGPSVRFAECVLAAYTNLVVETRTVEEADKFVLVQATVRDLERNIANRQEVRRSIAGRDGKRYKDHLVTTTIQAALSIALRNAIFRVVPRALWLPIWNQTRRVAAGDAESFGAKRSALVKSLNAAGVDNERLLRRIEKAGLNDIGPNELIFLRNSLESLQAGDSLVEDLFPDKPSAAAEESAKAAGEALGTTTPKPAAPEADENEGAPTEEVDPETGEVIPPDVGTDS